MICSTYILSFIISSFPHFQKWEENSIKHELYIKNKHSIDNYYEISNEKYRATHWVTCKEEK